MGSRKYEGGWDPGQHWPDEDNESSYSARPRQPWEIKKYLSVLSLVSLFGLVGGMGVGDIITQIETEKVVKPLETQFNKDYTRNGGLIGLIALPALFLTASSKGFYEDMKNKYRGKK
jgi:hypothetical protein